MPRYFFGENAGRPIRAGGQRFTFSITANPAGTLQGVVAVPDDQVDVFLAVANRFGVMEITQEAYEEALAKKKANPRSQIIPDLRPPVRPGTASAVGAAVSPPSPVVAAPAPVQVTVVAAPAVVPFVPAPVPEARPPLRPMPPLKGNGAKVVDGASIARHDTTEKLPSSIDDAVDLGTAAPPVAEVPKKESTRRLNHKQKRGTAAA